MKEKNTIKIKRYKSPCGVLLLGSFGEKLCLCDWQVEKHCDRVNQRLKRILCAEFEISTSEIIEEAIEQLNEYFAGQRKEFNVPLLFVGTDFQKTVWNELLKIPFGKTISYGEMAKHIGRPQAVRAVANANGANSISLLHLRGVSYSLVHGLCTCCAVYSIVNVQVKEENLSFLLTLTKKAKNRRIKRNFIKNIFRAALSRAGYCLGHGLGLHLLPRQFHLPSFPGNIGHKSSLPVFPVNSSQQNRPAPEAVFPPESSPVFSASAAPHFQCHSRNPENTVLYNDTSFAHTQPPHVQLLE